MWLSTSIVIHLRDRGAIRIDQEVSEKQNINQKLSRVACANVKGATPVRLVVCLLVRSVTRSFIRSTLARTTQDMRGMIKKKTYTRALSIAFIYIPRIPNQTTMLKY